MTEQRRIYATERDIKMIKELLREANISEKYRGSRYLEALSDEIERAIVVKSTEIPPDIVTMNTIFRVKDMQSGEEMELTLVYPDDADLINDKISILAPIGTAALGYRVGDVFDWEAPDGTRSVRVTKIVYQPEASGDYHL